jgi:hypothetical protein
VAIRGNLEEAPDRREELDRAFSDAIVRWSGGREVGPVEVTYEFLLVVGRRASRQAPVSRLPGRQRDRAEKPSRISATLISTVTPIFLS